MATSNLTPEILRSLLEYDPKTGVLAWRKLRRHGTGGLDGNGYMRLTVRGETHHAHRLIWLYVYGDWPTHRIDHINGDPADNRIENLRDVNHAQNMQNRRQAHSNSKTGLLGVFPHQGRFTAQIYVNGKAVHIGCFATPEEAHEAYLVAKRNLHPGNTL